MVCDTRLKPRQTLSERAAEVRKAVANLASALSSGRVTAKVGPQGALAFIGLTDAERDGVTDGCLLRRILSSGSPMALQAIARAEALAGRSVNKQVMTHGGGGIHSHDSGKSWHSH